MATDHYQTLGVGRAATAADLRAAYLKLARENHPDRFNGVDRKKAESRMQAINEAWNILGVAHKRREYDATNSAPHATSTGSAGAAHRQRGQRGHAHFTPFDDEPIDRADVDLDPKPLSGSKGIPRWLAFCPPCLLVFGVITIGFATMVNSSQIFGLGVVTVVLGIVSFLMMPLYVMSRAERDPKL